MIKIESHSPHESQIQNQISRCHQLQNGSPLRNWSQNRSKRSTRLVYKLARASNPHHSRRVLRLGHFRIFCNSNPQQWWHPGRSWTGTRRSTPRTHPRTWYGGKVCGCLFAVTEFRFRFRCWTDWFFAFDFDSIFRILYKVRCDRRMFTRKRWTYTKKLSRPRSDSRVRVAYSFWNNCLSSKWSAKFWKIHTNRVGCTLSMFNVFVGFVCDLFWWMCAPIFVFRTCVLLMLLCFSVIRGGRW